MRQSKRNAAEQRVGKRRTENRPSTHFVSKIDFFAPTLVEEIDGTAAGPPGLEMIAGGAGTGPHGMAGPKKGEDDEGAQVARGPGDGHLHDAAPGERRGALAKERERKH